MNIFMFVFQQKCFAIYAGQNHNNMIVLIGHGYIGQAIAAHLQEEGVQFEWVSHTDKDWMTPDVEFIINAAGFTGVPNVDACEVYKQETIDGNVHFPLLVEEVGFQAKILHISSGCVYTGYKDGGWTEEDEPNFNFSNGSFYSGVKALEQKLLQPYLDYSYLLRIRMPFDASHNPKNLLEKLTKYDKLIDFKNSLTSVPELARVVLHFIKTQPPAGIYNVCNPGGITTKEIADILGLKKEWFTEEEFKAITKAPRSNCVLNTDKLSKIYKMKPVREALQDLIK